MVLAKPPEGGGEGGAAAGEVPELDSGELTDVLAGILGTQGGEDTRRVDPTVAAGKRAYFEIWGVKPPGGYIEGLVKQGLNVYEIIEHELSKPQARRTNYYRRRYAEFAELAARVMGMRP